MTFDEQVEISRRVEALLQKTVPFIIPSPYLEIVHGLVEKLEEYKNAEVQPIQVPEAPQPETQPEQPKQPDVVEAPTPSVDIPTTDIPVDTGVIS